MSKTIAAAARNHALFWTALTTALFGFLWLLGGILTPFVLGAVIAYLLAPIVNKFEKNKLSRSISALLILILFYAFVTVLLLLIAPPIYREAQQLAAATPELFEKLWAAATPHLGWLQERLGTGDIETLKNILAGNAGKALTLGGGFIAGIGNGGRAVAGFFALLALTPLVSFFMMKEWTNITAWIDGLLPRGSRDTIRDLLRQIDRKMSGFIRGQISVACALALLYGIGLFLTGLKFGFLIGLTSGLLYIIPYLGTAFGLVAGMIALFFQGFSLVLAGKIAVVFVIGQIVETYFLTPRLVGASVGLHPLWILFAVMAGAGLFGVTGMLLAVPAAAVVSVLMSFAIARYKESDFYADGKK